MTGPSEISAVVLAAGAGERFGGGKQFALLRGRPLVRHAVDAVAGLDLVGRVVVVAGAEPARTRDAVRGTRAEVVECPDWAEGIAASLRTGFAAAAPASWVLITLADEPLLPAAAVRAVAEHALRAAPDVAAVRALWDGRPGHPVALRARLAPDIQRLRGDEGARTILAGLVVEELECGHHGVVVDVDTPGDLGYLEAGASAPGGSPAKPAPNAPSSPSDP